MQLLADSKGKRRFPEQMDTVRHEYQDSVRRCSANRQRGKQIICSFCAGMIRKSCCC